MEQHKDIQRQDEISRQRAYGEDGTDARAPMDADQNPLPGFRYRADATPTPDRGVFRDDGAPLPGPGETADATGEAPLDRERGLVLTFADDRSNTVPDTYGADRGPKPDAPQGDDPDIAGVGVSRSTLAGGYTVSGDGPIPVRNDD